MKVSDLFEIKRGWMSLGQHEPGPIPLVSATTLGNGVVACIQKQKRSPVFASTKEPILTVSYDGVPCFAAIQYSPVYLAEKVFALIPNKNSFWGEGANIHQQLVAISAYIRKQKWRYSYARKAGSRLRDMHLDIDLIRTIAGQVTQSKPKIKTITQADVDALLVKLPKGAAIHDLFDMVKRNTFENSEASESGAVPLVSASSNNNAVVGFVDTQSPKDIVPGGTISVAKDGVPMIARVQRNDYAMNTHIVPLQAKVRTIYTDKELAIIAALIETQGWRYNYMRAAAWSRMGPQVIT